MSYRVQPKRTPLQDMVMYFLREWKADPANDGNSPTYQDIAKGLGKYRADIRDVVLAMERAGKLKINQRGKIALDGKYLLPDDITE